MLSLFHKSVLLNHLFFYLFLKIQICVFIYVIKFCEDVFFGYGRFDASFVLYGNQVLVLKLLRF